MKTKMGVLVLTVLLCFAGNSFAEEMKAEQAAVTEAKNVGNKICPVEGGAIGSMGEAVTVEREGKIYNLCCEACVKSFNEDPEKYHKIADQEVNGHVDDEHAHGEHNHADHK